LPLYDYQCRACSKTSEVRHGFRDVYQGTCPACGSDEMSRVFNPAGIVFKGSGFYVNDSRPKSTESASSSGSAPAAPATASGSASATASGSASAAASGSTPAASSSAPAPAGGGDSAPKKSESSAA
jgi:putative FmdB family regulatory protein